MPERAECAMERACLCVGLCMVVHDSSLRRGL